MAGDFNCTTKDSDRQPKRRVKDGSVSVLRKLCDTVDIVDASEECDNGQVNFTHWQGNSHARLDRIYMSASLKRGQCKVATVPVPFSDHALVATTISLGKSEVRQMSGQGHWKLNEELLKDEKFCHRIASELSHMLQSEACDACTWEKFKLKVQRVAKEEGERRKREEDEERKAYKNLLLKLVQEEEANPGSFVDEIKKCKEEYLRILQKRYRGAVVRSREQALAADEQP
ncbi:uncharacterized protein LOC135376904 [Ornithodoros turicata]|uniref:uncharacterized protein LOC135376904 n=1 Tax=Ornithodoros turicata TaxID=34597 RepID=UPI003139E4BD